MKKELNVLMLEDNPSDAALILRELRKVWKEVKYQRVFSGQNMENILFTEDWDLIISDYSMPQFTGIDGLKILKESGLDLPFIMVSGTMGEDVAVSVMKAGAQDYILKDKLHRLAPAIERELAEKEIRHEHKETTKALDESKALSEAVIDGSPIGISVRDRNGTLILSNQSWKKVWGFSEKEVEQARLKRRELVFDKKDGYLAEHLAELKKVYEEGGELYVPEIKLHKERQEKAEWISQHFYALKNRKNEVDRIVVLTKDITNRKNNEMKQYLSRRILQILNKQGEWHLLLRKILHEIQELMNFECLGIRLSQEEDFPYIATIGFRNDFENHKCYLLKEKMDNHERKEKPEKYYECLCGKIVLKKTDFDQPYFTETGSFWTNNLQELVKQPEFENGQIISRDSCVIEGYQSLALIPLISGMEVLGIIQINDTQPDKFTAEIIKYFEEIGSTIAIAFQRIQSEKKLIESEKHFRSLFENSIMGIFRLSAEGRILMMNPCLLGFLGYSSIEEFEKIEESPADDFRRIIRKLFNNIQIEPSRIHQFEASWSRKDRKSIYVSTSARTIQKKDGSLMYVDGVVEDRTDKMKATRALLESREIYRSLVEKANVGIVTDDLIGNMTYFNTKFAELFGYTHEEMSALSYKELFHPDHLELLKKNHNLRVNGKKAPPHYELLGVKKDGSNIFLEIAVDHILDDDFNINGTRAFLWDVTERKQADAIQLALYNISMAISSSEHLNNLYYKIKEYLGTIIDTTNIFVAFYDKEKDELSLPFEVDERDHFETFPAGNSLTSYVIKQGIPMMFTEDNISKLAEEGKIDLIGASSKIWLGAPLKTKERIIGVIVVQSYDNPKLYTKKDLRILSIISNEIATSIEKKRTEDNLRIAHDDLIKLHKSLEQKVEQAVAESREKDHVIMQQSRQVAIGEMISSIAHHWRQPLNIIGVTFQSVREAFEYNELTSEYMSEKTDIIMDILHSLSKTIDDFRFFYRREESSNDFDLGETVLNTIYTLQSKFANSNIELNKEIDASITFHGYKNEYSQVVLNILTNAYDILVERNIKNPYVNISLKIKDGHSVLSIRDNGGGVDKEIREKVFDLYISTKKNLNNTGIGLYIAKLVIEKHMNGKLYIIDHDDGAEFVIEV